MSPLQILGVAFLIAAVASATGGGIVWFRRGRTVRRVRSEAAGALGELASASDRAAGEFEAAIDGMRSAEGAGLTEWLARLARTGRQHGQTLDAVHKRLERFTAVERRLSSTAAEVALQKDRVDALCRSAEEADLSDPKAVVLNLAAAATDVVSHERRLRAEATDAKSRLEGRIERLAGAERDALTDPVTRLPNRRAFEERLASHARRPEAPRAAVAVVFVDALDRSAGRPGPAADAVLAVAGRVLREAVRPRDFAARVGAAEFAVMLPGEDAVTAAAILQICRRAAEAAAVGSGRGAVGFTFRGGVAEWRPGDSASAVLDRAREAAGAPEHHDASHTELDGPAFHELARAAG